MVAQILKDVFMFYDQFYKLCKARGKKPTPVAKELGCTSSNVALWKKGSTPRAPVLAKIAEYFDVTEQYLLFGDESDIKKAPAAQPGDELSAEFREKYSKLPPEQQKLIEAMIDSLLSGKS